MAAGEAFASAALHQASTMARLTCFCCPACTLSDERCRHEKLQNKTPCSRHDATPALTCETGSSCNAVLKRLTSEQLQIVAFIKVDRRL